MTTEDELVILFAVLIEATQLRADLTVQAVHPPIQVDIATKNPDRQNLLGSVVSWNITTPFFKMLFTDLKRDQGMLRSQYTTKSLNITVNMMTQYMAARNLC